MDTGKKMDGQEVGQGQGLPGGAQSAPGFSAVSQEALKYLEATEEKERLAKQEPQKFILTKQTLAKKPVEFGPTKELPKKRTGMNKKLVMGLIAAIMALFVVMIVTIVVGAQGGQKVAQESEAPEVNTEESDGLSSGGIVARVAGEAIRYEAAYIVDGVHVLADASGVYESTKNGEVVFLVINGGILEINGDVTIRKTGDGEVSEEEMANFEKYGTNSAVVVIGEYSEVRFNGPKIEVDAPGAYGVFSAESQKVGILNTTFVVGAQGVAAIAERFGGTVTMREGVRIRQG